MCPFARRRPPPRAPRRRLPRPRPSPLLIAFLFITFQASGRRRRPPPRHRRRHGLRYHLGHVHPPSRRGRSLRFRAMEEEPASSSSTPSAGALSSGPVRRPRRPARPAHTSAVVSHGRGPSNAPGAAAREAEDGRLRRDNDHGVGQRRGERERAGDGRGQFYLGFRPQLATFVDQPLPLCTKNARSLLNDSRHPNDFAASTIADDCAKSFTFADGGVRGGELLVQR